MIRRTQLVNIEELLILKLFFTHKIALSCDVIHVSVISDTIKCYKENFWARRPSSTRYFQIEAESYMSLKNVYLHEYQNDQKRKVLSFRSTLKQTLRLSCYLHNNKKLLVVYPRCKSIQHYKIYVETLQNGQVQSPLHSDIPWNSPVHLSWIMVPLRFPFGSIASVLLSASPYRYIASCKYGEYTEPWKAYLTYSASNFAIN